MAPMFNDLIGCGQNDSAIRLSHELEVLGVNDLRRRASQHAAGKPTGID